MCEKYLGQFKSLLYKLLLSRSASAFNTSGDIRNKEVQNTSVKNSVPSLDSFLSNIFSMAGIKAWNKISIFSQQHLSVKMTDRIICNGCCDLVVS